ncbi:MAG: hypothetical protein Q7K45_04660, partial [Nanoarchaeota archaeon]|nr:hypothetical protein [Nanoarchaeota archaeon]
KDYIIKESSITCAPLRLIYEQRDGQINGYRLECYSKEGGVIFRSPVGIGNSYAGALFCFEEGKCETLYSSGTIPVESR